MQDNINKMDIYRLQHYTEFRDVALRDEELQKLDPQKLGTLSVKGETLLHIAILQKDWQFCAMILKKNTAVANIANKKGDTPLHYLALAITKAPSVDDVDKIKKLMTFLLQKGADINQTNKAGKSPRAIITDFYATRQKNNTPTGTPKPTN